MNLVEDFKIPEPKEEYSNNEIVVSCIGEWLTHKMEDIKSKEDWDALMVFKLLASHFHPSFPPSKTSMIQAVEMYHKIGHWYKREHFNR